MKTVYIRYKKTPGAMGAVWLVSLLSVWFLPSSAHAADDSGCARVKIEIKQELTLERQAFDAEMRITNGLSNISLQDVNIAVNFLDDQRRPVLASSDPDNTSALFFIRLSSMENISDVNGSGTVAASSTADIHWLIIPTIGASKGAPQGTLYYVGATLAYTIGGEEHVTEVTPDYIYVKPLPRIALDYFLPSDVYGDDAFTAEIEPPVPFNLGVRVSNNGQGVARKLKINSAQPKIVDNQQGLLIGFVIEGTEVNGNPAAPSLLADFGDIAPNACAVARWIMTCSLSGRFVEFKADYTHSHELGGELTSLLEDPITHFLVRDVLVDLPGRDRIRDFLAIDGAGAYTVYESEKIDTPVANQSGPSTLTGSGSQYTLTTPVTAGFMVVKLSDPNGGQKTIKEVIRSDGKRIKAENAWLAKTRAGSQPWQHFVYLFDANTTGSYTVSFGEAAVAHGPVLEFVPDRIGLEGQSLSFVVQGSDPDGTIPKLSAAPLPAGAGFTEQGNGIGAFAWTPAEGQAGRYEISFAASDGTSEDRKRAALLIRSLSDTDGDGMLDSWERTYFSTLDRDGQGDFDGDGLSDLDEFLQGKDPTKSNAPGTPEIYSPEDEAEVAELQPQLAVTNSTDPDGDALTYDFELYSDDAMTLLVVSQSGVSETAQTTSWAVPQELNENAWHFWRVRATDGYGFSQWAYGTFFVNTVNDPPGPFNISSPADKVEVSSTTPVLEVTNSFDVDEDVLTYSFEVYGDSSMTGPPIASATGVPQGANGSTSWTVSTALNDNAWYYWRVVATDEHGASSETTVASFFVNTKNDAPGTPTVLDPADGAEVAVQELDLKVTNATDVDGDTLSYFFELDKANTFDSLAKVSSGSVTEGLPATGWRVSGLEDNTWYYWRAKASDGAAESSWVTAKFFVSTQNDAPSMPTLRNPGNGSWVSTLTPTLEVNASTDPDNDRVIYRFEVYADSGLRTLAGSFETDVPSCLVTPALSDNTWYFWRAQAEDEHGLTSAWTEGASFFTDSNGVNDPPVISLKEPAYPVTVREGTVSIRWEDADPDSSAVIALYYESAMTGRVLIAANIEEDSDGSGDTWLWNLSGLPDGTYSIYAEITDAFTTRSSYASGLVTIDATPPSASASPLGAEYFSPQSVTLAASEPGEIYYTTDGSEPTLSSLLYAAAIPVFQATTLKFIAVDIAGNQSNVFTETYVIQDTDNDYMLDAWEMEHFGDLSRTGSGDEDNDGLSDLEEYLAGTDPGEADTDGDGLPDGWEVGHGFDPLSEADASQDADGDGFTNLQEYVAGTDPGNPDSRPLPPVADAGKDLNVKTGQPVTLDGSNSFDPEGVMITYEWSFTQIPQGSSITDASLSDAASPKPTFTPDKDGSYVILLSVSDGMLTGEDDVMITAATPNVAPNADAGANQSVATGDSVTLDGTASNDPDGKPQPLTYLWSFEAVPEESELTDEDITNRDQVSASFTPDVKGLYTLRLTVSDGEASSTDTVGITAVTENVTPTANAGPDITITLGQTAYLDGSASSDPDASPSALAYQWRFVSMPSGSSIGNADIGNSDTATPSFTPDVTGTYVLELSVNDGEDIGYDNVAVTVNPVVKPGDLDGDGRVTLKDLPIFLASLGKCRGQAGYNPACDYDRDGCVTLRDYQTWIWYYLSDLRYRFGHRWF
jgi:hypothetical protein